MNATKNTLVEVMEFHGHQIAFEEINGKIMVNAQFVKDEKYIHIKTR